MIIVGIACYFHNASACILKDGKIIAAAMEERFSRKKHDSSFPYDALKYCFEEAGITIDKVDFVAFYEKPIIKFERILSQHINHCPLSIKTFVKAMPSWANTKLRVVSTIRKTLGYRGDILFVPHHMCHAASCFLPSPYEEAAIVTVDGVGEWSTTTWGVGKGNQIELKEEIRFPDSIGLLYSTITAMLSFRVNSGEYKVMGLSAYGNMDRKTNKYYKRLRSIVDLREDGSFHFDYRYFVYQYSDRMPSKALYRLMDMDGPCRGDIKKKHSDIAAATQMLAEDILTSLLNAVQKRTKAKDLCMAGGVALNSVFNGKILSKTGFERVWIQPDASDGGTSLGAAIYAYCCILDNKRVWRQEHALLGPSFPSYDIKGFLDANKVKYSVFNTDEELLKTTSRLIFDNKVIGWFQGRMEWGPRALGSRSILANPCNKDMQNILNAKVKHREKFRPFAPVFCMDDADRFLEVDKPIPEANEFMLMVYKIKERWRKLLPSITHVDGTGRPQLVRREINRLYYDVIKEFGKLSGVPVLINTSFNIRGEPIVCTPEDAFRCMMGTGIDYLVMDRFLIKRADNPKHMWDSEELAKD
ncbi:MAG: hypothetical protein KJ709_04905 [Nanoarchaeota archaeon]|nr:hypothetical protein [Nanoarchaeota archaeon]